MSTVVLDVYSKGYPSVTNRIRCSVALSASPLAIIASIIDTTAGHPQRTYHFPGLPRNNYAVSLDEIDGSGNPINNFASFDVVPGTLDGLMIRDDEQIQVNGTTGFTAGASSFTFDGTGGKPNYIGWEIVPSELTGREILVRGLDYSWDKVAGTFTLLQAGDIFAAGNYYNIDFEPIQNPAGNSYPTITDFTIRLITATGSIDTSDFGNKIIVEPGSVYIELTLPAIATVPDGRRMMVEVGGSSLTCCKFLPTGSETINFLRGNIYALPHESFAIYKFTRSGTPEWRVDSAEGNFKTVGQSSIEDIISNVWNRQLLNGASVLAASGYARVYNEIVLNLPLSQRVDYDLWATGNNKYLFSLANSADPSNAGKFHFPDRRGLFERNNNSGKAGDYFADSLLDHFHLNGIADDLAGGFVYGAVTTGMPGSATLSINNESTPRTYQGKTSLTGGGTEIAPKHYLINKYILI